MVAQIQEESEVVASVGEVYCWLDSQIAANAARAGQCEACGKCCDFDSFDHLLYVTAPELMYLANHIGDDNIRSMKNGRCPYNVDGQCTIRDYRFSGCRIFCCKGSAEFQSELTELTLRRLKTICEQFDVDYRYADLASSLSDKCSD